MSWLSQLHPIFARLPDFRQIIPFRNYEISTTQKVVVISVSASVTLLGVLARYLRRRRRPVFPNRYRRLAGKRSRASGLRSPNGDITSQAGSGRRSDSPGLRVLHRQGSVLALSDRMSLASGSLASGAQTADGVDVSVSLTPQQLGVMGMEALETSINYWEDALATYTSRANPDGNGGPLALLEPEDAAFCRSLQQLLDIAYALQENSELLFLDQRSVLFRPESSGQRVGSSASAGGGDADPYDSNMSSVESFASAQDQIADLREFEEFSEMFPDIDRFVLYQAALKQLEDGGIPYRALRTETVKCGTDGEYLAKLHCIRLAFQFLFLDANIWSWFANAGRQMLADLLLYADKDPKDFLVGYEEMLDFLHQPNNWAAIEAELSLKGVKALTFYDVVLDYILMDAFEDLDAPPSSVTAVVQNRWLSNGFKETALTTAVWSVLKAKRRMLKFPQGFMAHFYVISEQMSPLMAWGFLGPDESLHETCLYFKEQVMGLLSDIFSFRKCRFTSVEELSEDILTHVKQRVHNIGVRLAPQM